MNLKDGLRLQIVTMSTSGFCVRCLVCSQDFVVPAVIGALQTGAGETLGFIGPCCTSSASRQLMADRAAQQQGKEIVR